MITRLLRRPAVRFALLCVAAAPLAGCAGISMSCGSSRSTESGTVVVTGAPASAERGATIRLDLTGTQLVGGNEEKERCITHINTYWSDAWEANQRFTVPADKRCQPLSGFTIDVTVPTHKQLLNPGETSLLGPPGKGDPYVGGTLTIQANGWRDEVQSADGRITWVGSRLIAVKTLTITVPPAANAAPTADLFARMSPMPVKALTDSGAYASSYAAVDARMSTDPEGTALTFAWDLDGDGVFGDAADGGSGMTGLPAGVAIVPAGRRAVVGTTWVAVQVSDAAGQSATRRLDVRVADQSGVDAIPPGPKVTGLDPTTATVGGVVGLVFSSGGNDFACVDPDGASPLSASGQRHSIQSGTTFPITAGAVGNHRVSLAFWFNSDPVSCAAAGLPTPSFTWSDIYTSTAPRRASALYRARVNLTTSKAVPIASSVSDLGILTDVIGRGRYALSAPAKARGVARPKALGLFKRGDFVASAPAVDFLGAGANETPITTSTMLLRGTGGVLACVRAESTASGLSYSFLGGTGAARRIVADAIATPAKVTPPAKPSKTVKPQRRPVRGNAQMVASTGSPRALPAACKALIRHLP